MLSLLRNSQPEIPVPQAKERTAPDTGEVLTVETCVQSAMQHLMFVRTKKSNFNKSQCYTIRAITDIITSKIEHDNSDPSLIQ